MRISKKTISVLISIVIAAAVYSVPAHAMPVDDGRVEIVARQGSSSIRVNGEIVKSEKPFAAHEQIYVPMRLALEAIGAEVNWLGDGKVNLVFRDVDMELTIGERKGFINQEEKELAAPLLLSNGITMIPLQLLEEYFKAIVRVERSTGEVSIVLENDGALEDLSFLIGGISKPRAGNSYFGWSMDVPKGSRVAGSSFNSKTVMIENEQRKLSIEITVTPDNGKTLQEYLENMGPDAVDTYMGNNPEPEIVSGGKKEYLELLYGNEYDEAVYHRIYRHNGYYYHVVMTSYREADPLKLKGDKYLLGIMNSFSLEYTKTTADVQDLSKIKYGLARYENYLDSDDGKKYSTWEMDVLPEWDILDLSYENPFIMDLGLSKQEYVSVEMINVGDESGVEDYAKKTKELYDANFNSRYYSFMEMKVLDIAGYKACKLIYAITIGNSKYVVDENFILSGGILYDITIKTPQNKYSRAKKNYYRMLDTFKIAVKDPGKAAADIEKYRFTRDKNRVGKDDSLTVYANKTYGWALKMPGYWIRNSQPEMSFQSFTSHELGGAVIVEASENIEGMPVLPDEVRFFFMGSTVNRDDARLVKKDTVQAGGRTVRHYKYRIENKEEEFYYSMDFYVLDEGRYSYCFMSSLPDLCTSEKNLKEIQEIWESFTLSKPEAASSKE